MKVSRTAIAIVACVPLATAALGTACKEEAAPTPQPEVAATTADLTPSTSSVAKIVFIGKQNACDCTRERVEDSLAALRTALDGSSEIPVEELHVDVEQAEVAKYQQMRSIVTLPAIYLLSDSGALVELLQGEVTEQQFRQALGDSR